MKNNIDGSDINVGNIDEDIKIVRSVVHNKDFTWYSSETTDDDVIDNAIENVLLELETYKKIAEKLAELLHRGDEVDYICDLILGEHCVNYKTGECNQCIIDWARKEVEKNV